MPPPPDIDAVVAIALSIAAIYLFTRDKLPIESTALLILIVSLIWLQASPIFVDGRRLGPRDLFAGFGNEALITIAVLLILARGLEITGALQPVGHALSGLWRERPRLAFLYTLLTVAVLSMFLNNTPVVAAVLPLLVAVSMDARVSPSGVLMPVGFATIIGGMATTIGTSTNLLVMAVAASAGVREFHMFDFAMPVLIVGGIAILFLWWIAPGLLPPRTPPLTDVAPRVFESVLRVEETGYAEGRTLTEVLARTRGRMRIERITRGGLTLVKLPLVSLRAGDRLHVRDTPANLKEFERLLGATLLAGETGNRVTPEQPLESSQHLAEVVVTPQSMLDGAALDSTPLLSAYELVPLALNRPGRPHAETLDEDVARIPLEAGDILLVQGEDAALERLKRSGQVLVLDGRFPVPPRTKAPVAAAVMAGVVGFAAVGALRISIAAVLGLSLMLATRCMTWRDVLAAIDRRIILVIVASLALGLMLTATGAAEYIATLFVWLTSSLPTAVVLSGFILIMALLTEVATNNAIAVLGTPIAISVARQLDAPVEPFVLGVLYGANMSYITPFGYQTNLLVMSAGGYRFSDFVRVGVPLQIIMWLGMSIVLPLLYGLG